MSFWFSGRRQASCWLKMLQLINQWKPMSIHSKYQSAKHLLHSDTLRKFSEIHALRKVSSQTCVLVLSEMLTLRNGNSQKLGNSQKWKLSEMETLRNGNSQNGKLSDMKTLRNWNSQKWKRSQPEIVRIFLRAWKFWNYHFLSVDSLSQLYLHTVTL